MNSPDREAGCICRRRSRLEKSGRLDRGAGRQARLRKCTSWWGCRRGWKDSGNAADLTT